METFAGRNLENVDNNYGYIKFLKDTYRNDHQGFFGYQKVGKYGVERIQRVFAEEVGDVEFGGAKFKGFHRSYNGYDFYALMPLEKGVNIYLVDCGTPDYMVYKRDAEIGNAIVGIMQLLVKGSETVAVS